MCRPAPGEEVGQFATLLNLKLRALRSTAGSVHLGIIALIAVLVTALIFFVWYPAPLSKAEEVDGLVLIMIGVDVVIVR